MPSKPPTLQIGPPGADEIEQGLDFAWQHLNPARRLEQVARFLGEMPDPPHNELLVARRDGKIVGAIWAEFHSGKSASINLPQLAESEPTDTATALLNALVSLLDKQQVQLAQALLEIDHGPDFDRLRAAGFEHFADLLYMVSTEGGFPDALPATDCTFEPYSESNLQRLAQIISRTYVGTRDCPQLNGLREVSDIIDAYRATGQFDPNHWFFIRNGAIDIGCLLLAEHPQSNEWELLYMGIVPEVRGRGCGIAAVRYAQHSARRTGVKRLILAVDANNDPAIEIYAAAGFVAWDRRSVLLRLKKCDA